jgi:mannose/fructose/N-acetylgalactosamine-specific phosphotransferase system component IIC
MPAWLNKGMTTVAGVLPAVGFATLLKYMNLKSYGIYVVLGFILASYLNLPMLAIAGIALVFAFNEYRNLEKGSSNAAVSGNQPTAEQIASGNYDE